MAPPSSLMRSEFAPNNWDRDIINGWLNLLTYVSFQDRILIEKGNSDLKLYEELLIDDRLHTGYQTRFTGLTSKELEVLPGGEKRIDKQAAEYLHKQLESLNWDEITTQMAYGLHYGFSIAEIIWVRKNGKVAIEKIKVKNRRRFRFGNDLEPVLLTRTNPMGETLPERKFWFFRTGADNSDVAEGKGLGHILYWLVYFKRNGLKWWITFLENFADPSVIGKYPVGTAESEKKTLEGAVQNIGKRKWATIPEAMVMELLEASRNGTSDYQGLYDLINTSISQVINGQNMTTESGSSEAQSRVHQDIGEQIVESDDALISGSFNEQVARWITEWNFPGAAIPIVRRKLDPEEDLKVSADRDKVLADMGFAPNIDYIVEKYGDGFKPLEEEANPVTLNGAQTAAFAGLIVSAQQGGWSADVIRNTLMIAFPHVADSLIDKLAKSVEANKPPASEESPTVEPPAEFAMSDEELEFKLAEGTTKTKNGVTYILTNSRWRRAEPKPKAEKKSKATKQSIEAGFVGDIDISQISADPKRFQYKLLGQHTKTGEAGSLSGVTTYDPNLAGIVQTWKDPADGKLYIINGHNRLALAQRAGAQKITTRVIDAPDAATARGVGALTNIAEGRGTALDAAKFFRDSGLTADDIKKKGIPLREKIATDGLGIAALEPHLFDKVVNGELSESRAALLGKTGLTGAQQTDLYKLSEGKTKKGKLTDDAFQELADSVKASQKGEAMTLDLFGASTIEKSNALERASLTASIKQQMSRDKKLFGLVSKSKVAKDLARGGNQIDTESSGKIADSASQLLGVFDQLKNQSGGISSVLNSYASQVSDGKITPAKAKTEAYKEIAELIKAGKL